MMDPNTDATEVVRRQLEAYNARDIEAFMANWAEDAQIFAFPSDIIAQGAAEIRARHIVRFKEPNLFGRLVGRMAVGNVVVDREVVMRTFPEGPGTVDVIAIYEIDNGRIAKAWLRIGMPMLDNP